MSRSGWARDPPGASSRSLENIRVVLCRVNLASVGSQLNCPARRPDTLCTHEGGVASVFLLLSTWSPLLISKASL